MAWTTRLELATSAVTVTVVRLGGLPEKYRAK
jgi:hypothetical protein